MSDPERISHLPDSGHVGGQPGKGTFGFEFELLIPFTACGGYQDIRKPKSVKKAVVRKERLGVTLKLDEQSKMNAFIPKSFVKQETPFKQKAIKVAWAGENMTIPEIVTDVLTSQISEGELSGQFDAIAGWADELVRRARGSRTSLQGLDAELAPVTDETGVAVENTADLYLGPITFPNGVEPAVVKQGSQAVETITASAYVHQTYALPLDKVLDELSFLAKMCKGVEPFAQSLQHAAARAPVDEALSVLGLAAADTAAQLGGFFALVRYYALALSGVNPSGGLGKNHPALLLFYKTDLGNIRAKLVKNHPRLMDELAHAWEDNNRRLPALARLATGVEDIAWKGYMAGLIGGTGGDHVFGQFKNEYSDELWPGGDALGVVVENRRLVEMAPPVDGNRYAPREWAGLAEVLRQRLSGYWPAK